MNKNEKKEAGQLDAAARFGNIGYAARGFSALIRATKKTTTRNELIVAASYVPAVMKHADFVI